jgi:hypothetical protein
MKQTVKDLGGVNSLERLKLRCRIDPITDCWKWSMAVYEASNLPIVHARFPWNPDQKKKTTGRRAAIQFKLGRPLQKGWFVWGTCGNHLCCNPDHSEYGDANAYGDAMRRYGWHKGSAAHIAANRKNMASKRALTDGQAQEIRLSNLSIEKLAEAYGVSKTTIADIRRGARYKQTGVANSSVFAWRPAA